MYDLIKTASNSYAEATGNDPIDFALEFMSKLGFTKEEEQRMMDNLEKDFSQAVKDEKITVQDRGSYSVGNILKFKTAIEDLLALLKGGNEPFENVPRIAESQTDRSAVMGFTMALEDLATDLKDAKKEITTRDDGRKLIRYDIKSDNFKDAYNLLKKLPAKTKAGRPFKAWLMDNFLPYIEMDVKTKGKTKRVLDYGRTFRAQEIGHGLVKNDFVKPIRDDIRKEMNETRRNMLASLIRKLASTLKNL